MKNKLLLAVLIVLIPIAVWSLQENTQVIDNTIYIELENETLNLEDYVYGVVGAEMPASFSMEALKAQAISARTNAIYYKEHNLKITKSLQAYKSKEELLTTWDTLYETYSLKVKQAVQETCGYILTYEQAPIKAYYYSMSNGYTEDSQIVFNETLDYIQVSVSPYEEDLSNFQVETTLTRASFLEVFQIEEPIEITNIVKDTSNRIESITINGTIYKGTEVRSILGLRSTDFNITLGDPITITTKGYGHGVGMSQYGANEMAKRDSTYKEILNYYYPNTQITKYNP